MPAISFEDEVLARLLSCSVALRRGTDARLTAVGLTTVEYVALRLIANAEWWGLAMYELSRRMRLSPATSSRIVGRLETKNLVTSYNDQGDRRCVNVVITATGANRYLEATATTGSQVVLKGLSQVEVRALYELLRNISTWPSGIDRYGRRVTC